MSNIPSNKTLAKAIVIFGGTQVITILATIIRTKVSAEYIGPEGVGLNALFITITSFIGTAVCLGLTTSSIQVLSKLHDDNNTAEERRMIGVLRLWECLASVAGMAVMIILAPLLCHIYFGNWQSHLHSILLLSIVPASLVITGMESAILKSMQQTRRLTNMLILQAILSVVIAVPLYITMGWDGIPYVISVNSITNAAIALYLGYKTCSERPDIFFLHDLKGFYETSRPMLMLGFACIITSIGTASMDLIMQSYINAISTIFFVGLYKSGYMLSMTYPSMIFTAIDNDFFPRLTALSGNIKQRNILITRQILVLLSITTPCILIFIALLPWIIPILLAKSFEPLIPMVSFGALAIIVRAAYLPIAYMPLALGKSKDFIHLDLLSNLAFVVFAIIGCKLYDLTGIGISFIVSQTFDLIYVYIFCRRKYNLSLTLRAKS